MDEEDQIFSGGIRVPRIRAQVPDIRTRGVSQPRSALEIKKTKETGRPSLKKAAISKAEGQKARTKSFREGIETKVKQTKLQKADVKKVDLETKFENPIFKDKITKVLGEKAAAFGKKLSPDELRTKVESRMEDIRSRAEARARENAARARQDLANTHADLTNASRADLDSKINTLKDDFANKLEVARRSGPPEGRQRLNETDANTKAGRSLDDARANLDAYRAHLGDTERFRNRGDGAKRSGDGLENPRRKADPESERINETDANGKAEKARTDENAHLDQSRKARDSSDRFNDGSKKPRDSGDDVNNPRNRGDDPDRLRDDPERLREDNARNKADDAVNRSKENLKENITLVDKFKKFLGKILKALNTLLMLLLPFLTMLLPPIRPPRSQPFLPPPPFITFPPPPIIPPGGIGGPDGVVYVPGGPGVPSPYGAPPSDYESYGNIMFQLTDQPSEDVSFQIQSMSDNLEFDDNIITILASEWNKPVYTNFITTLESSADTISGDMDEQLGMLKQPKRKIKHPEISVGSLDDYSASPDEIYARKKRLEYLLKPSETIQQALAKINKRVGIREQFKGGYEEDHEEYRGTVTPTFDDEETESIVEPIYDESDYTYVEPSVTPSDNVSYVDDDDDISDNESIITPTYEDSDYKPYEETVVPTLDGGQENDYDIPDIDYDTIADQIDESQLGDAFKAEVQFTLVQDISYPVNVIVSILDPTWTIQPNTLYFDNDNPSTNSFFFSQEIFQTLQNLHVEQQLNLAEDNFEDYIDDTYESEMNEIYNQENTYAKQRDDLYNNVYRKTYDQEMSKLSDAEYVLNQLGGSYNSQLKKLKTRTRKLRKVK